MMQHSPNCNYLVKRRLGRISMAGCCGAVGLIVLALLCPVYHPKASAEEAGDANVAAESGEAGAAAQSVQPSSVSISLTEAANIDITPTMAGTFGAGTAELSVSTNNASKYSVFLRTEDGEATLKNVRGDVINAVSADTAPDNFPANSWGYALGQGIDPNDALYNPVPVNVGKAVLEVGDLTGEERKDDYTLAFGVKMDTSLPSGEYVNKVLVSVIGEGVSKTLADITTMQEMSAEICEHTAVGSKKELTDIRDGKIYTVFKAKDGNCWMKTNLAIAGEVAVANVAGGTGGTYQLVQGTNYWDKDNEYGLYYNFAAATAGTDKAVVQELTNASASICPTGADEDANWVLPRSGKDGNWYVETGSFEYLLGQYGGVTHAVVLSDDLMFQRGGTIDTDVTGDRLVYPGVNACYWARTSCPSDHICSLFFNDSVIYANGWGDREDGYNIRCLYPSTSTKEAVLAQ